MTIWTGSPDAGVAQRRPAEAPRAFEGDPRLVALARMAVGKASAPACVFDRAAGVLVAANAAAREAFDAAGLSIGHVGDSGSGGTPVEKHSLDMLANGWAARPFGVPDAPDWMWFSKAEPAASRLDTHFGFPRDDGTIRGPNGLSQGADTAPTHRPATGSDAPPPTPRTKVRVKAGFRAVASTPPVPERLATSEADAATLAAIRSQIAAGVRARAEGNEDQQTQSVVPPAADARPTDIAGAQPPPDPTSGDRPRNDPALRSLGHELRTPLAAIAGLAEAIATDQLGASGASRYREYAADIAATAKHSLEVVEAMLGGPSSAQTSTSDQPSPSEPDAQDRAAENVTAASVSEHSVADELGALQIAPTDVADVARGVGRSLKPIADARGVSLIASAPSADVIAQTDGRALKQILFNLVGNAIACTPKDGRVAIDVRMLGDGRATLRVTDNGVGMDRATLAAARGETELTPAPDHVVSDTKSGQRLGLPLVRALATQLDCRLRFESAPGAGTRVTLVLPA
ncbi:MAG: ATP-binding protein [Pseudomonadota bacterium]